MFLRKKPAVLAALLALIPATAHPRVIIQYFETDWDEVEHRIPEVVMVGYDALWLPPPQKGAEGVRDVGFSVFDRFDLGDVNQRGTTRTRYGTKDELVSMCDSSHRMDTRVLFDVVMNHNANPSLIENQGVDLATVPLDGFPDTIPLDYHVLAARDLGNGSFEVWRPSALGGGTFTLSPRTGDNEESFVAAVPLPADLRDEYPNATHLVRAPRIIFDGDLGTFEVQSYSLLGLVDFAIDQGTNGTLATPLPSYIRQPDCATCYPGDTPVPETIVEYLYRWILWLKDETGADGFRLDAVKHAPTWFFDEFNQRIQDHHDLARGFSDGDDRDLIDDAQLFGESFSGDIQGDLKQYFETGQQMLNFPLFFSMTSMFSSGSSGNADLGQLSFPQGGDSAPLHEFGGLGRIAGVSFAQSHDSLPPDGQPNLAYAFILTRIGDAVVFFDGNNPDPRSFVQPGRPDALGDLGSRTITDLVYIHNHFARGGMWNRFVDDDAYVYERVETGGGATLLVVLHDNIGAEGRVGPDGVARFGEFDPRPLVVTAFPPGTVLHDYTGNSPLAEITVLDPADVSQAQRDRALAAYDSASDFGPPANYGLVYLAVPSGPDKGYAMYAPRVPQGPGSGARALTVHQAGQRVPDVTVRTVGEKRTAAGARVAPRDLTVPLVTGRTITVRLRTDATATSASLKLDRGGFVPLTRTGTAADGDFLWESAPLDVSMLPLGMHMLQARGQRVSETGAGVWNTFTSPVLLDDGMGGGTGWEPLDRDGDGVASAEDNCADTWNSDQGDFDNDGVGDLCDHCPAGGPAELIDADGCRVLPDADLQRILAVADEVMERRATASDLVSIIDEVNP
jgi:alpha-amylase